MRVGDIFVKVSVDDKGVKAGLSKTEGIVQQSSRIMNGFMERIGHRAFDALIGASRIAVTEFKKTISASSDLTESINKTGVAFASSADEVMEWSKTSATAMGLSQRAALEGASSFGMLFRTMGLSSEASADMSTELVQLAADMASINNISPEEALIKLRAGLVGEIEPLRTVGVLLDAATVEAKAMQLGLAATTKELTQQDKVLARYQLILEQTALQQGDFANTSAEIANAQRVLAAQTENLQATVGKAFEPIYKGVLTGLNTLLGQVMPYGEGISQQLAIGFMTGVNRYILPVIQTLRGILAHWFRPQSPPRIAAEIDKWGAETANQWLKGFLRADFGILDTLGKSIETAIRSFASVRGIKETDVVSMILGGKEAVARAITEFRSLGTVSESTIRNIARAAGPAGEAVSGLVKRFFDLERANRTVVRAQEELNKVTRRYDDILNPLNEKLSDMQDQQSNLRDQQRIASLRQDIASDDVAASDKKLAQMEIEEIQLRSQIRARERERDTAVDAAKDKIDAAEKEQSQAQEAMDVQMALFEQQMEQNRLVAEEINLLERLAEARKAAEEAANTKAQMELEKALREQEAAMEAAKRKAESLYQAQLNYNLSTADGEGKLALLRLELMRYSSDSEEYWHILTQIAATEKQLAAEREAAAKAGAGAGMFEMPDLGEIDTFIAETDEKYAEMMDSLMAPWLEMIEQPPPPLPAWVQDSIDAVTELAESLQMLLDTFAKTDEEVARSRQSQILEIKAWAAVFRGDWAEALGYWKEQFVLNADAVEDKNKMMLGGLRKDTDSYALTAIGKWMNHWDAQKQTVVTTTDAIEKDFGDGLDSMEADLRSRQEPFRAAGSGLTLNLWKGITGTWDIQFPWLSSALQAFKDMLPGSEPKNTSSPLYNLKKSGSAIIDNLWSGLKTKWAELSAWWTAKMTWIRAQLPFSEPKDASSPLRGLDKAGESIVKQINDGMAKARFNVTPTLSAAFAGAASNVTNHNYYFDQTFGNINSDVGGARQASRDGIRDAMRARGLA